MGTDEGRSAEWILTNLKGVETSWNSLPPQETDTHIRSCAFLKARGWKGENQLTEQGCHVTLRLSRIRQIG